MNQYELLARIYKLSDKMTARELTRAERREMRDLEELYVARVLAGAPDPHNDPVVGRNCAGAVGTALSADNRSTVRPAAGGGWLVEFAAPLGLPTGKIHAVANARGFRVAEVRRDRSRAGLRVAVVLSLRPEVAE